MGRKQTIDREELLNAAERVALRDGAGKLTIEAVAIEAGVSKGGVLYAYSTKDALIDAMFTRVFQAFDIIAADFITAAGDTAENHVRAHVRANRDVDVLAMSRSIALMTNFMRSPEYRKNARQYYDGIMSRIDLTTPIGRRARLALLASEGALFLRGLDFLHFGEKDWQAIQDDILAILLPDAK